MRVFMTTDGIGGVWSYTFDLAQALCRRGDSVTLAVLGPAPHQEQCERARCVRGLSLVDTGLALDWTAQGAMEVCAIAQAVARLAAADVVQLHTPALAAFDVFDVPVIVNAHSCVASWWQAVYGAGVPERLIWQRELAAAGYKAAQTVIAPSSAFAAATRAIYTVAPVMIHNGRSLSVRRPRADGGFVFTSGRLWDPGKNFATLDAAAAMLPWPVLAAGSLAGPNSGPVELRHVRCLGWSSEREIADHLARAPVFVSVALYEPFGLSVLEAAQAGCALVLSDIVTFRELWDGAASFVDPTDAEGLAAAITGLLQDPQRRAAHGAAARARAARYTLEAMAAATIAVYDEQLAMA